MPCHLPLKGKAKRFYGGFLMSLEFSQELDNMPMISPTFVPQDAGEIGLRP